MFYRMSQYSRSIFVALFFAAIAMAFWAAPARPAAALSLIRDSEIETYMKDWLKPFLKAANMGEDDVRIIIVGSDQVNAFVAGGRNIFIYTGLILEAEKASEVVGVMAHELGHIEGGHLVRMREEMEMASYQAMLAGILGIGIATIGGAPEVGSAVYTGGNSATQRQFLKFSRTQESAADQAALKYFDIVGYSPEGLESFMQKMEGQELLSSRYQSEYMRTHPVTRDRIKAMAAGLARSPHAGNEVPASWQEQFERIKAKIQSYMDPSRALGEYSIAQKRDTMAGQYALAIVDYRQGRMDRALKKTQALIDAEPDNPYFHEFKGQILLESQQITPSIAAYKKALSLAPEADLVRIDLAQALVAAAGQDNRKQLEEALKQLKIARRSEKQTPRLHRLAATIHGRLGHEAMAQLHLAEEALLKGNDGDARMFAGRAEAALKKNKTSGNKDAQGAWLRVQDILQYLNNKKD